MPTKRQVLDLFSRDELLTLLDQHELAVRDRRVKDALVETLAAAHRVKLDAFLERYCVGLSPAADDALRAFWHGWNAENATGEQWRAFSGHLPEIAAHTRTFCDRLTQLPDLSKTLADFCRAPV